MIESLPLTTQQVHQNLNHVFNTSSTFPQYKSGQKEYLIIAK